jgi:hypothetical protein
MMQSILIDQAMRDRTTPRRTIGFISTWPVYQGTTLDRYAHSLIQGISAAAAKQGCNLLLSCGFSITGNSTQNRSTWPVPSPAVNFVPAGPWNTDELIILPDELSDEQTRYMPDLPPSGFPVISPHPMGLARPTTGKNRENRRCSILKTGPCRPRVCSIFHKEPRILTGRLACEGHL